VEPDAKSAPENAGDKPAVKRVRKAAAPGAAAEPKTGE
jgi:hypothetical protein